MHLQLEINDAKSSMFLKLLDAYKMDKIVNTYTIINDDENKSDFLADIDMLADTLKDAKKGLGKHTGRYLELESH